MAQERKKERKKESYNLSRKLLLLLPCLLLGACASPSTPPAPVPMPTEAPPETDTVSAAEAFSAACQYKLAHAAEFLCADYLLRDRAEIFAEYDGVSEHMKLAVGQNRDWGYSPDVPAVTDTVYYWRDAAGTASPGRAASVLLADLLEDLKGRTGEYSFALTDYAVPETQENLRDWKALLQEDVAEIWHSDMPRRFFEAEVSRLLPQRGADGEYSFRSMTLGLPPVEDMWVLIPSFSFAYDGVCNLRQFSDIPTEELTAAGLLPYQYNESTPLYYILMRHGDGWQLQSYRLVKQRSGGSEEKTIDLSGLDICRAAVYLGGGSYNDYTDRAALDKIIACLDGKALTWEREYHAFGSSAYVKLYTSDAPDAEYAYKVVISGPDSISIDDRQSEHGYTFAPADVAALEQVLKSLSG